MKSSTFYRFLLISGFIFLLLSSCSILAPDYLDMSPSKRESYKPNTLGFNNNTWRRDTLIYSIDSELLFNMLENAETENKVVIFFNFMCPFSNEKVPPLVHKILAKEGTVILIASDDWTSKSFYEKYRRKENLNTSIFMLDVNRYAVSRNPLKRMIKFIGEICDDCESVVGFPSFLVFDKHNKIIMKKLDEDDLEYLF
jgi:hypothetical protein